ncbi:hypothetical protein [Myroides sp. WP-1]|uniref:hypothetical protein n=1 Tax=Myroides sp. WP-1 TaxID=2759944 RepID=UPI0015FE77AD|nr:hypothetical protein [Myroides sp. WP-1]MBB1140036.1 hypothetical protein [Myroides sp. WP-1]
MPLFSNKFRQNLSNLRKEKKNCYITYHLLAYLEHPNITPLGFYIFLDNLCIKNSLSFKKTAIVLLIDLGLRILQHQATLRHNLEDLEKLGILFQIQTIDYKNHLKQLKVYPPTIEDEYRLKHEMEQLLRRTNLL